MADIRGLIIHLERAEDRRVQAAALAESLPVPAEILPAVDARQGPPERERHDPGLGLEPPYPFPLSDTEIAVFLSHRRAWARIVEGRMRAGLVLEDDASLDPQIFPKALALASEVLTEDRFVRLPMKNREGQGALIAERDGIRAVKPDLVALNLQASLVGRRAAARLLRASARFDRPVDSWLQMTWVHGVEVLSLWPTGVGEVSQKLGGSTQKKRKGLWAKLRAERQRARYRAEIARIAQAQQVKST